jgi:hypothetical protein
MNVEVFTAVHIQRAQHHVKMVLMNTEQGCYYNSLL